MGTNLLKDIVIHETVKGIGVSAFNRGADYFADSITIMTPDCIIHATSIVDRNALAAVYMDLRAVRQKNMQENINQEM